MAAKRATEWPEGLSDEEAILSLQSLLVKACEGDQELATGRTYRALRGPLIRRADLADVVPQYIRAHRDLRSFWAYIRKVSEHWQPRREHIWKTFRPLFDRVEGRTKPPLATVGKGGRRTTAQQAQIVLALVPDAIQGVLLLIEQQTKALGNGGPVDPEQEEALTALRELHAALGNLLKMAEDGKPLETQLATVRALKDRAFRWATSPYGLCVGDLPLMGIATVVGCGVSALVNVVAKDVSGSLTMGAAATAIVGASALQRRSDTQPKAGKVEGRS